MYTNDVHDELADDNDDDDNRADPGRRQYSWRGSTARALFQALLDFRLYLLWGR